MIFCVFICILAVIGAFYREKNAFERLQNNKYMLDLAEKIKLNYTTVIRPISYYIEQALRKKGALCTDNSNFEEEIRVFNYTFRNCENLSEISDCIIEFSRALPENIDNIYIKMKKEAQKGYDTAYSEYEKIKKTVFIIYPGIALIIGIMFI